MSEINEIIENESEIIKKRIEKEVDWYEETYIYKYSNWNYKKEISWDLNNIIKFKFDNEKLKEIKFTATSKWLFVSIDVSGEAIMTINETKYYSAKSLIDEVLYKYLPH